MTTKSKIILWYPILLFRAFRSKRLAKKIIKHPEDNRYPLRWKNNYVLKKAKKFLRIINVKWSVKGFNNIPKKTSLLVPNHASSVDAVVLMAALENPEKGPDYFDFMPAFLAKKELKKRKNKFSGYMDIIDTHYIDRQKPREALKIIDNLANEAKKNHKQIIIFPEGTRSKNGEIQEFKSGAFHVAKKFFLPIVPVTINNTLLATDFSRKQKLKVEVIFHPPLKPMSFMTMDKKNIAKKVQKIVESNFVKPNSSIIKTKLKTKLN